VIPTTDTTWAQMVTCLRTDLPMTCKLKRIKRGLNQAELAEQVGMTQQDVSRFERGHTMLRWDRLLRIAEWVDDHGGD